MKKELREEQHLMSNASERIWSPDSRYLVFSTWGLPKTWWVEVGTWRTQQLALPKGAEVIGWVTPPE